MAVVVTTRAVKGSNLSYTDADKNFTDLQDSVNIARPETVTITTSYTATSKYVILADTTAGNITITLPSAFGLKDVRYWVRKVDSAASTVTIDPTGSETIDGSLTKVISAQWTGTEIISDGSNWFSL